MLSLGTLYTGYVQKELLFFTQVNCLGWRVICLQGKLWVKFPDSIKEFGSVQLLSRIQIFAALWTAAHQTSLPVTNSQSLLKLMSIKSVMPSSHLILCRPLLLLRLIPPSIRVFSDESALCIRWRKYWTFSFSISPSNEFSSVQSLWLFATPWTAAYQASLSITNSWSLLKLMSIESVMPSNHLILSPSSLPIPNVSQRQGLLQPTVL